MATKNSLGWSSDALLAKSQRFFEEMLRHSKDEWQFAHWSTLALELLARAALANISPTLLAEPGDWNNVYYALGHAPKAKKFIPKSITITEVFGRLREVVPDFTQDLKDFGILHMTRRNEDLHTGDTPFETLSTSAWLPVFYEASTVLAAALGKDLKLLVGVEEADLAVQLIEAAHDESAKAVLKAVAAHKLVWEEKSSDERDELGKQSVAWATRQYGHRVACPACKCTALVYGVASSEPIVRVQDGAIVETQQYVPARFECLACGLKISSLAQLTACELGDPYKSTATYSVADYYGSNDPYSQYEEDNNEP
jgi:hypothetical protein